MENQITLQDLPSEIKVMIFEHLPADRDLLTVRSVCHDFNNVILADHSLCPDINGKSQLLSKENAASFEALTSQIQSAPSYILDRAKNKGMGFEPFHIAIAYFLLGEMYLGGICKQPNYQKAYDYFWEAKEEYWLSEWRIVWMHQKGLAEGDPPAYSCDFSEDQMFWEIASLYMGNNYKKAAEFYQKAADQGSVDAQDKLGDLYNYGMGVSQDHQKAAEFYQKVLDKGYLSAQVTLGILYTLGKGVPQDHQKAMKFFQGIIDQGYTITHFRYA